MAQDRGEWQAFLNTIMNIWLSGAEFSGSQLTLSVTQRVI
jgi:hypothetical protein